MKRLLYPLLLFSLVLTACKSRKERMQQVWFFNVADFPEDGNAKPGMEDGTNHMILGPESFLNLQPDGFYTSYFGHFDEGKWVLNGDSLVLSSINAFPQTFHVRYVGKQMKLYYPLRGAQYTFDAYAKSPDNRAENPFSRENNRWRIPPPEQETDMQISNRLINHFHFWETYFSWGMKNNVSTLQVNDMDSPLQIYGNGFELVPFDKEPYDWKTHFFDEQDAHTAYNQLHALMRTHINWPKTDNRFEMFASVFKQMQQLMLQDDIRQ
jgi:hypothetical protein